MSSTRNRQARILMWKAMGKLGEFTITQVANQAGLDYGTAHKYVEALKHWDYVACIDPRLPTDTHKSAKYRLIMNTGPHAPSVREGGVNDPNLDPAHLDGLTRCWLAMRQLRQFDSPQLQSLTGLKQRTVETYLGKFRKAGLISVRSERVSGSPFGSYQSYSLLKDLGPVAPVFRRDGSVFDPNSGREILVKQEVTA